MSGNFLSFAFAQAPVVRSRPEPLVRASLCKFSSFWYCIYWLGRAKRRGGNPDRLVVCSSVATYVKLQRSQQKSIEAQHA